MDEPTAQPSKLPAHKLDENPVEREEGVYRTLIQASLDGFWINDFSGRILDVNEALCQMLGYPREELLRMSIPDIEVSEAPEETAAHIQKVIRTGSDRFQTLHRRKDGAVIDVEVSVQYVAELGERFFAFLRNITERKRMESKLLESYERFDLAVKGTNDGIWDWDIRTNANYFSPRFLELLGYEPDEKENKLATFETFLHPEDRAWVFDRVRQHLEDNVPYNMEYRMRTKNGEYKWFLARGQAVRDPSGKPVRMAGSITDLTERKQMEKELILQGEIERNMAEAVYLVRVGDRAIVQTNPAFDRMFGYEHGELIGKPVSIVNAPSDKNAEAIANEIISSLTQSGGWNGEVHNIKKDGTTFWCRANVLTLEHPRYGRVWLSTHQDITELKRAEQEIRQLNAELEQRVIQRTAQLQAANADLENFSYSVSHDLRAPLRAIDGFAAILREDYAFRLDEEGLRLFQVVSDNTRKMAQLIDDILAFSRASRSELHLSTLDMNALVQQVWQELEPQRAGRAIELRLAPLPSVRGDHAAVRQVWQNLLANAVKFTRGREPAVIEVGGRHEGEENIYSIRDNGVGFDMAYVAKLFGLFQRLHGMEEFEGTGVGLAIVKRFITKHGGRVWAEGKTGEGATFWFTLPAETIAEFGLRNAETTITAPHS